MTFVGDAITAEFLRHLATACDARASERQRHDSVVWLADTPMFRKPLVSRRRMRDGSSVGIVHFDLLEGGKNDLALILGLRLGRQKTIAQWLTPQTAQWAQENRVPYAKLAADGVARRSAIFAAAALAKVEQSVFVVDGGRRRKLHSVVPWELEFRLFLRWFRARVQDGYLDALSPGYEAEVEDRRQRKSYGFSVGRIGKAEYLLQSTDAPLDEQADTSFTLSDLKSRLNRDQFAFLRLMVGFGWTPTYIGRRAEKSDSWGRKVKQRIIEKMPVTDQAEISSYVEGRADSSPTFGGRRTWGGCNCPRCRRPEAQVLRLAHAWAARVNTHLSSQPAGTTRKEAA